MTDDADDTDCGDGNNGDNNYYDNECINDDDGDLYVRTIMLDIEISNST